MHQGDEDAPAAGTDRVPERDRAAAGVDPFGLDPQFPEDGERLGCERLVELEQVNVGELEPCSARALRTAGTGPMPMIFGSTPTEA